MLDPSHPAPIWLIWRELSSLERLSFVFLCFLAVYSLCLIVAVMCFRIAPPVQEKLTRLRKRVRNLRQATLAAFYFFGFALFAGFQFAYYINGLSSVPGGFVVLGNFQIHFAFAGNAFFVLLFLQFAHWFNESQVGAFSEAVTSSSERNRDRVR